MRRLKPEIVRLMDLAKAAADEGEDQAPFGFAGRVMAASRQETGRSAQRLQWAFSIASGVAMLVIVSGGVVVFRQEQVAQPGYQIAAAAHFLAKTISP